MMLIFVIAFLLIVNGLVAWAIFGDSRFGRPPLLVAIIFFLLEYGMLLFMCPAYFDERVVVLNKPLPICPVVPDTVWIDDVPFTSLHDYRLLTDEKFRDTLIFETRTSLVGTNSMRTVTLRPER